ncbi:hypothetical protein [Kribbella italica]|uniref:Uncharacterized protein n=1 Tax=Kribbella italica TaxID=1540520 RepID=A0A7W9MW26_9ACTN|nr:hypothetical protein [Kribbella italica]MBB5838561.1 hypothetical protein [Kribbella italica]
MRRSIVAGVTAVAVVATGLAVTGILGSARPAAAALGDVPSDCKSWTTAYRSDGQRLSYNYSARKTITKAIVDDKLGWVPTGLAAGAESGSDDNYASASLVTHPTDGQLYYLHRVVQRIDGVEKVTKLTTTSLAAGFEGTRILADGPFPYYYRVAGNSLYRFQTTFGQEGPPISTPVKLSGDWGTVNTLRYQRTGGTADAPVHVLFGTTSDGQLLEWRIPVTDPATITTKVLQATGWEEFTSLTQGSCASRPNGRLLLGIKPGGRVALRFDANAKDGKGTDFKGGSLGSVGWTEKAY